MDATPHIAIRLFTTADRVRHGWRLDSRFIEEFWLPILGLRSGRRRGRRRPRLWSRAGQNHSLAGNSGAIVWRASRSCGRTVRGRAKQRTRVVNAGRPA